MFLLAAELRAADPSRRAAAPPPASGASGPPPARTESREPACRAPAAAPEAARTGRDRGARDAPVQAALTEIETSRTSPTASPERMPRTGEALS